MKPKGWQRWIPRAVPLVAVLVLGTSELYSSSKRECIEFEGSLTEGEATEITIEAPTWLETDAWWERVYRLEVSGRDGSGLELWTVYFDSFADCPQLGRQVADGEIRGGTAMMEWTARGRDALQVIPPDGGGPETYSLLFEEIAAPPEEGVQVIPAVAHTAGVNGTFFQTDVKFFNPIEQTVHVELVLVPTDGGAEHRAEIVVPPGEILVVEDVVQSRFGLDDASGALRIHDRSDCFGQLIVISRTYNPTSSGTYGQFIPAEYWNRSAGVGSGYTGGGSRTLIHLAKSESFRSNVGFVEVLGLDAVFELEMVDARGVSLARESITLPALSHRQINDVFDFLGVAPQDNVKVTVSLLNQARLFIYASVVDNQSSDSIYIPGLREDAASSVLTVPVVAATDGAAGTRWRTDLRVMSVVPDASVELTFLPGNGSSPISETFDLDGSEILAIDDVVGSLGASGSGALLVHGTERLLATSRTYNVTSAGTFGQFIPAEDAAGVAWQGSVIGVERSESYRTNIGMFNPSRTETFDVVVRLVSDTGTLLGSGVWTMEPLRHVQINDIFDAVGAMWHDSCRVDFEPLDTWRGIHAYASVVDNRSGDSIYVPVVKMYGELAADIELDNRDNAVLIDELPEAVGVDRLPDGARIATVTGSGDLGRPDLPIQVLCLYRDQDGELSAVVLPIGSTIGNIAGGEPFWCVIPDWLFLGDNSGGVTITLTGSDQDMELTLDAQANAVLIDRLPESVVVARPPAEAYAIDVTGDLGRPDLPVQVAVMYRDAATGVLRVRSVSDGDLLEGIETEFQLLAVVVDWMSRLDNTGTTAFEPECMTRPGACGSTVVGTVSNTDCDMGRRLFPAERVTFDGRAGQIVTVAATWESTHGIGYLDLADPTGMVIASSEASYNGVPSQLADVALTQTGTHVVWVTKSFDGGYSLEISCQGP